MKNLKVFIITVTISVITSLVTVYSVQYFTAEKIAFIRTGYVLSKYDRMVDANKLYEEESTKVKSNMDTLRSRWESYKLMQENSTGKELKMVSQKLMMAENDYNRYSNNATQQLEQRRIKLTNEVITELNATMDEFGRINNYKIILGSTDNGSLLYGDKGDDISEEIIQILNLNYKDQKGN